MVADVYAILAVLLDEVLMWVFGVLNVAVVLLRLDFKISSSSLGLDILPSAVRLYQSSIATLAKYGRSYQRAGLWCSESGNA